MNPIKVAEIKRTANIVHVIGQFVRLRPSGHEYEGLCPFHEEKTPSFKVSPSKNGFNCFGCGVSGDVIRFIQTMENIDFQKAAKRVAELSGMPAPIIQPVTFPRGTPPPVTTSTPKIGPIVAVYPYTDENNAALYEVVRHEPGESYIDEQGNAKYKAKAFRQRAPDGTYKVKGIRKVLYRLPKILTAAEVWLCEGEKDVHTLESLGLIATTNSGGANDPWQTSYTESLSGRHVIVCPDNDEPGRARGERIAAILANHTLSVTLLTLPSECKDVTDFIAAGNSAHDLRIMVEEIRENAQPVPEPTQNPYAPLESGEKLKPNDIARLIIRDHVIMATEQGFVYEYNHRVWERTSRQRVAALAMAYDTHEETKSSRRREAADYVVTRNHVNQVKWRQIGLNEIPVWNGVYDLKTATLRQHRKEDFLEAVPATPYIPDRECPNWLAALEMYWGQDPDYQTKHDALQEFFGYVLMSHARYKKALLLYGESDTGKSQIATVLRMLVGDSNTCCISVEAMDDPRRLTPIMGKMINLLTEVTSKAVVADGGFKTLVSGEEAININPKYQDEVTYIPTAKHIIVCNTLPRVTDHSRGTFNRLLLIKFNHVIPKSEQDKNLSDKLKREAEGILGWALEGAKRLNAQRGEFTIIPESEAEIIDYRDQENPINAFVAEWCDEASENLILLSDFCEKLSKWAGRNYDIRAVGSMLRSAGYDVAKVKERGPYRMKRCVIGLEFARAD
jgi:P4 family phage/plasmid primase-like protien